MTKKQFIIRLEKYLREKSIYKEKELIDYKVFGTGEIKLYYKVKMVIDKTMILKLSDIGINQYAINVKSKEEIIKIDCKLEDRFGYEIEYEPFSYLKKQGVI